MLDYIYHMALNFTLESRFWCDNVKNVPLYSQRCYRRNFIALLKS